MRSYLLFVAMLAGAFAVTAILGTVMDQRVLDQEQRREQGYLSD
jgi:hypothetical protein